MSTAITPPRTFNSIFQIIREAIRGSERDFTQGPIGLGIFLLAVPMILEMSMESLFAVVDIFFVAKLGADAVAIVGLTESVMALIYAVAFGLAIGATATVARRTGEKDPEGAARSAAHVLYLGVIVSVLISAIGINAVQLAVATSSWNTAVDDSLISRIRSVPSNIQLCRLTWMRPPGRNRAQQAYSTPTPRPIVVPTAAPVTPISGNGPTPKMKHGAKIILSPFASTKTRMAIAASPAPRKMALSRKMKSTTALPPSIIRIKTEPSPIM